MRPGSALVAAACSPGPSSPSTPAPSVIDIVVEGLDGPGDRVPPAGMAAHLPPPGCCALTPRASLGTRLGDGLLIRPRAHYAQCALGKGVAALFSVVPPTSSPLLAQATPRLQCGRAVVTLPPVVVKALAPPWQRCVAEGEAFDLATIPAAAIQDAVSVWVTPLACSTEGGGRHGSSTRMPLPWHPRFFTLLSAALDGTVVTPQCRVNLPLPFGSGAWIVTRVMPSSALFVRVVRGTRFTQLPPPSTTLPAEGEGGSAHGTPTTPPPPAAPSVSVPLPPAPSPRARPMVALAGQDDAMARMREICVLPFTHPRPFQALRVALPTGVLLHGPAGVGKTQLVRAVAWEVATLPAGPAVQLLSVRGPELLSAVMGETERRLRHLFQRAAAPACTCHGGGTCAGTLSLVFFDEVDALFPHRTLSGAAVRAGGGGGGSHMDRIVTQFLTLLDGVEGLANAAAPAATRDGTGVGPRCPVRTLVVAATNRPGALDAALRRPGRFDSEVRMRVPDVTARHHLLQLFTQRMPLAPDAAAYLPALASMTVGYVGADLKHLCLTAAIAAAHRLQQGHQPPAASDGGDAGTPTAASSPPSLHVTRADFDTALVQVHASALRDRALVVQRCSDGWADIGGMHAVVARLRQAVELPMRHAAVYARMGVSLPRGILLHGPPGNSKTSLVRALASAVHATFISLSGAEVVSAFVGESERMLRATFALARDAIPCILFFDELDALVASRGIGTHSAAGASTTNSGVLATFLTEMDGVAGCDGVLVIGATNRPDSLDPALLRPGRLELHLHVPQPDGAGREAVLAVHMRRMAVEGGQAGKAALAARWATSTDGWSGADLAHLCREAAMVALRRSIHAAHVTSDDFAVAAAAVAAQRGVRQ